MKAKQFIQKLKTLRSAEEAKKIRRYFKSDDDVFIGVRMGQVFALAKEFMEMEPDEIELLLENPIHEARVGAVSIMDFQARNKNTSRARKKELFDLYMRRHDRINNWDLVDRSAPYVIGGYLLFLDQYAATMPRTALRYAIEHLDKKQRDHYLGR